MKKSKRPTFEEVTYDKTFTVVGAGDMPKGEYFWCAFCGGRGIHFVLLERNDGKAYKVGNTCIGRVGLELPKSVKKVTIKRIGTEKKVEKKEKPAKVEKKEKPAEVEKKEKPAEVEKKEKPAKVEKKPEQAVVKKEEVDIEDIFDVD